MLIMPCRTLLEETTLSCGDYKNVFCLLLSASLSVAPAWKCVRLRTHWMIHCFYNIPKCLRHFLMKRKMRIPRWNYPPWLRWKTHTKQCRVLFFVFYFQGWFISQRVCPSQSPIPPLCTALCHRWSDHEKGKLASAVFWPGRRTTRHLMRDHSQLIVNKNNLSACQKNEVYVYDHPPLLILICNANRFSGK